MSEEHIYLETEGCTVTSARIVIDGQTFATRNVGSVRVDNLTIPTWAVLLAAVGAAFMYSGLKSGSWAVITVGAVLVTWGAKRINDGRGQRLMMMAGAGEVAALTSRDKAKISQIHTAIAQAISSR